MQNNSFNHNFKLFFPLFWIVVLYMMMSNFSYGAAEDSAVKALINRIRPIGQVHVEGEGSAGNTTAAIKETTKEAPTITKPAENAAAVQGGGDKVTYDKFCAVCHTAGVAGAPKFGDSSAWKDRIAKGKDKLYESAIKGFKLMPPKGICMQCTDAQLKEAVDYMIDAAKQK